MIWALAGCPKAKVEEAPPLVRPEDAPIEAPAGTLEGDLWADGRYPFTLDVPPGWIATPGVVSNDERLGLRDPDTNCVVTVTVRRDGSTDPLPRGDCAWNFVDTARYRVVRVTRPVTVATCTPHDPEDPRRLGWYVSDGVVGWAIEARVPHGAYTQVRPELEGMLGTVRLR